MPDDIAARCEVAEGPDRELDAEIDNLLAGGSAADLAYILANIEVTTRPPHYTASVDCALSLVPAGSFWHLLTDGGRSGQYQAALVTPRACPVPRMEYRWGATPALALCAAALRARAG